ncbi:hypothetical protein SAY87_020882 [Trapa incisa]|uniref:V-type proton ATPase proteolipid subunit n=2 Tax=Pentapetalae TaxID=1437201 RepID=A0AAN7JQJ5_9MYRT|nr:hypothetical protein SAY87_020882 [Trapa incisa]
MSSTFSGDETAPFFGFLGAAAALVFSCMGAAYGTAKSGVGVASMGVMRPELVMKSIVPVVMAGVLGIYGLIIAVIISTGINPKAKSYYLFDGYAHLSSGLACGLAGLSAGMAIGIVGDAGVRYGLLPVLSLFLLIWLVAMVDTVIGLLQVKCSLLLCCKEIHLHSNLKVIKIAGPLQQRLLSQFTKHLLEFNIFFSYCFRMNCVEPEPQ